MDKKKIELLGYMLSSGYRTKTLLALKKENKIPSRIANETGIKINHISNILKELKEKKLIVCLNEEAKKNRIYKITPLGREMAKEIEYYYRR